MAEAIDAIVTQQPGSKTYQVMRAVAYYAGLRPSDVVMVRVRSAQLPAEGSGRLDITEADPLGCTHSSSRGWRADPLGNSGSSRPTANSATGNQTGPRGGVV